MANQYILFEAALPRPLRRLPRRPRHSGRTAGRCDRAFDEPVDELEGAIEDEYTTLMEAQRDPIEAADGDQALALRAVAITLPGDQPGVVRTTARHARRLSTHFSVEDVHELVAAIAQSVTNPVAGPLCHKS